MTTKAVKLKHWDAPKGRSARGVGTSRSTTRDLSTQTANHIVRFEFAWASNAQSLLVTDVHSGPLRTNSVALEGRHGFYLNTHNLVKPYISIATFR